MLITTSIALFPEQTNTGKIWIKDFSQNKLGEKPPNGFGGGGGGLQPCNKTCVPQVIKNYLFKKRPIGTGM